MSGDREARARAARAAKERGTNLYTAKNYAEAIKAYDEAIAIAPKDDEDLAVYRSNRSACYLQLNDAKKAMADAEICVKLRPTWARGWSRLAAAKVMLLDDVGAERALEKWVSYAPDNLDARRQLMEVRERLATNPRRASTSGGWKPSMPSMPSMPSLNGLGAAALAVVSMARMRYDRGTPNERLVVHCVLSVLAYYVATRWFGVGSGGGYGYDDYYDSYGSGFSLWTLIGIGALYSAWKSGASIWTLLSIANMFGIGNGGRRGYGRGYGGYGRGYGRGYGIPGMF